MHDLSCADPDDMNYKELADRARYFKKDEEGRKIMSKIMEQLLNEEKIEAAKRMLERGKLTKEEIAEDLDLPLSVVERLENDLQLA
jgi:AraC-like DNA-binding protein